jgi:hypothetical protein
MRMLRIILLGVTLVALGAGAVAAQDTVRIGNLNDPVSSVPGILYGNQRFAYLVVPGEQASCPNGGCVLTSTTLLAEFTPDQVPAAFAVSGGLIAAEPGSEADRWVPGDDLFQSPAISVTIDEPGIHAITVPMQGSCDCVPMDQPYFLNINFLDAVTANVMIDREPAPGVVYLDSGNGFIDLDTFDPGKTSDGKVIIWGDIVCCIVVEGESSTWGGVKSLFR